MGGIVKKAGGGAELATQHSSSASMSSGGWGAGEEEGEREEGRLRDLLKCALTRVRGLLVLVSHPSLVLSNPYLSALLDVCALNGTSDGALLGWRAASLRAGAGAVGGGAGAPQAPEAAASSSSSHCAESSEGTPAKIPARDGMERQAAGGDGGGRGGVDEVASTPPQGQADNPEASAGGGTGVGEKDNKSVKLLEDGEAHMPPASLSLSLSILPPAKTSDGADGYKGEQSADDTAMIPRTKLEASSPMCGRMGVLWPSIPDRTTQQSRESTPSASPLLLPQTRSSPASGPSRVLLADFGAASLRLESPTHGPVGYAEVAERGGSAVAASGGAGGGGGP